MPIVDYIPQKRGENPHLQPAGKLQSSESWSGKLDLPEGGPRQIDLFGPSQQLAVLRFRSSELEWRNMAFREAGASWDWPEYSPHISFAAGPIPEGAQAFQGKIVLGPEVFEELEAD